MTKSSTPPWLTPIEPTTIGSQGQKSDDLRRGDARRTLLIRHGITMCTVRTSASRDLHSWGGGGGSNRVRESCDILMVDWANKYFNRASIIEILVGMPYLLVLNGLVARDATIRSPLSMCVQVIPRR